MQKKCEINRSNAHSKIDPAIESFPKTDAKLARKMKVQITDTKKGTTTETHKN